MPRSSMGFDEIAEADEDGDTVAIGRVRTDRRRTGDAHRVALPGQFCRVIDLYEPQNDNGRTDSVCEALEPGAEACQLRRLDMSSPVRWMRC